MKSRYDFIKESFQRDAEGDGDTWPDILSLNYNAFRPKVPLEVVTLSDTDIEYFWKITHRIYGTSEYDDIVLTLNGYSHRNLLKPGAIIFFPSITDIETGFALSRGDE